MLQTFSRSDPAIKPLLVHVGRSFITDVTLQVGSRRQAAVRQLLDHPPDRRCFAAPASAGCQSFQSLVLISGRVEVISFPFTTLPWLKVWNIAPSQPFLSNAVSGPYNYPFANEVTTHRVGVHRRAC